MTWNPHDPTAAGGYADWKRHGEEYGNWGQMAGSTLVPDRPLYGGSSSASTVSSPSWSDTSSSSWWPTPASSSGTSSSSEGSGQAFALLICFAAIIYLVVAFLDEILISVAGLFLTAIAFKVARVCSGTAWPTFFALLFGLILTSAAVYTVHLNLPPRTLGTSLLQIFSFLSWWLGRSDLLITGAIGVLCMFIAFFFSTRKMDLITFPFTVLVLATISFAAIAFFNPFQVGGARPSETSVTQLAVPAGQSSSYVQSSSSTSQTALPVAQKVPPGARAYVARETSSSIPRATEDDRQSRTYDAVVSIDDGVLRMRSCPGTCDVIARLPKGLTVRVVSAGQTGWPEVEAKLGSANMIYRGFVDGSFLK